MQRILFFALPLLALWTRAQSSDPEAVSSAPPTPAPIRVSVIAADPSASEAGPSTGAFLVRRTGPTDAPLTVRYQVSGTAVPPGDYEPLPGTVVIPAGSDSETILVKPVDDDIAEEDETVVLTIVSLIQPLTVTPAAAVSTGYDIGKPSSATVVIHDNDLGHVKLPTVSIRATVPQAAEPSKAGKITISRLGDVSAGLQVDYTIVSDPITLPGNIGGPIVLIPPAKPGVDYQALPGTVTIPAGAHSVTIVIQPIDDKLVETREHVTLKLTPNALFNINQPDTATVIIQDNEVVLGTPPVVSILTPKDGQLFNAGGDILIAAQASDPDSSVATVEFFANGKSLGVRTNTPSSTSFANPFQLVWKAVSAGTYELTAKATDQQGLVGTSPTVKILVQDQAPPPDASATLVINAPKDGASFIAPADLSIQATAVDPKGYINRVEFYANDQTIGVSQLFFFRAPDPGTPIIHNLDWTRVQPGKYTLVAKAKDSSGALVQSPPVTVVVLPSADPIKPQNPTGPRIEFQAEPGQRYSIEASSDLQTWIEVETIEAASNTFEFTDPAPDPSHRFYRAVPIQAPVLQE